MVMFRRVSGGGPGMSFDPSQTLSSDVELDVLDDPEELLKHLNQVMSGRRNLAIERNGPIKTRWAQYVARKQGTWQGDEPDEELTQLGGNRPTLAKFIDLAIAECVNRLISDPGSMDFVSVSSDWLGLEDISRRVESLMRKKFREMRPDGAENFFDALYHFLEDFFVLGNTLAIVHNETIEGNLDDDWLIQGPVASRLDPFNVHPENINAERITDTNTHIYSPVSDDELDRFYPEYAEEVRRICGGTETSRDPEVRSPTDESGSVEDDEIVGQYPRYTYYGRFPIHEVLEKYKNQPEITRETIMNTLAEHFGFSPQTAAQTTWWQIESIREIELRCRPYPLALPHGKGPVAHLPLIKRNGLLWGHGMYDRAGFDERLQNFFERKAAKISALAASPPLVGDRNAFDEKWIQSHGHGTSLQPDEIAWASLNNNTKPIYALDVHTGALPFIMDMRNLFAQNQRDLTGINLEMEGFGKNRTATGASINLQQGQTLLESTINRIREIFLFDIVTRCYVVLRQAMREIPEFAEMVPMSLDERSVRTMVPVSSEHLRRLEYFTFKIVGATSPGNRQEQFQALSNIVSMFMPLGTFLIPETARYMAKVANLRGGIDHLLSNLPQEVLLERAYTAQNAPGFQHISPTPQLPQMQSTGPTGNSMMPGPGSVGGNGNTGPQQQTPQWRQVLNAARS